MLRTAALALLVTACTKKAPTSSEDCATVTKDPATALATLSAKYPKDPVKVAEVVEKCVAPEGEECARLEKIVTAIPTMTPGTAGMTAANVVESCKGMPPAMRRCMFPSYVLAHADECMAMREKMIESVEIKPRSEAPAACHGGTVSILIDTDGVWMGTGRDGTCFKESKDAPNYVWLESELRKVANAATDCRPDVELAAVAKTPYEHVIGVMDIAVKVGLPDVGLSTPATLAVKLPGAKETESCPPVVVAPAGSATGSAAPPVRSGRDELASAPVLIITKTEATLRLSKKEPVLVGATDDLANGDGTVALLANALPPKPERPLFILQADRATDMAIISRLIETAKAAGYDDVLFAVKNR